MILFSHTALRDAPVAVVALAHLICDAASKLADAPARQETRFLAMHASL